MIFKQLNLSQEICRAIGCQGFREPTPIQEQAIPLILEGRDIIGQAQTGTGKTCAFAIPGIEHIDTASPAVQMLVICPTRELALQTTTEISKLLKFKAGIRCVAICGGQPIQKQIMALKRRPQIIVGTPGRIMDHMKRKTLRFNLLNMVVLDEADEMLKMGFREDIETILSGTNSTKQTVLFSATMSADILTIARTYLTDPVRINITAENTEMLPISQFYIKAPSAQRKTEMLSQILHKKEIDSSIIFCNTKRMVDDLAQRLTKEGYNVGALHGDLRQVQRDKVMSAFRKKNLQILVATDVAARGVDVSNIGAIFNYDLPNDLDFYVHRIGRTGRAGKSGVAYSFVHPKELGRLRDIARFTKNEILPMTV